MKKQLSTVIIVSLVILVSGCGNSANGIDTPGSTITAANSDIVAVDPNEPDKPSEPFISHAGNNMAECLDELHSIEAGWCEITLDPMSVMRSNEEISDGERGREGPRSAWLAWNGAAINYPKMWFHGGGHNASGMIDVYEADLEAGTISRIYTPPPFNSLVYDAARDMYAWRHDGSLPESTHTYDGFTYDPETGLLLLITGYGYTYGFFSDPNLAPDDPRVTDDYGRGIWAFNPTSETVKGIAPNTWRRLGTPEYATGFPRSAYLGDNRYIFGTARGMYKWHWDGENFVEDGLYNTPASASDGTFDVGNGLLWLRQIPLLTSYDIDTGAMVREYRDQQIIRNGKTLAFTETDAISWDGGERIYSQSLHTGKWRLFDWNGMLDGREGSSNVYSKWFKHPRFNDIFIGWSTHLTGALVYKHSSDYPSVPIADESIQTIVDTTDPNNVVIPPGVYTDGAVLREPTTIDLSGVRITDSTNNGVIVAIGGPHVIKNFTQTDAFPTAMWGQYTPYVTLDGFDFRGQGMAIMTGSSDFQGEFTIKNGQILDGREWIRGKGHNIYAGEILKVTVDNVLIKRTWGLGHLFKSRARVNIIENSTFDGDGSTHSRIIDISCGGEVVIRNSTMIQSVNSDNVDLISIAVESACRIPENRLTLENTKWVAVKENARFLTTNEHVDIVCIGNNEFVGVDGPC